ARDINRAKDSSEAANSGALLQQLANQLGLMEGGTDAIENWFNGGNDNADGLSDDAIDKLIQQRQDAKNNKDWANADKIRDELQAEGILLEDNGPETIWRRG
ncbi:MAG: cysteine--tRNA ligase, partial [Arenicellales bacterium]